MTQTYTLSIEPVEGKAFQYGYHLGTGLELAKQIAAEKFHARNKHGLPTRTVALFRGGDMIDVYDGDWMSDIQDLIREECERPMPYGC